MGSLLAQLIPTAVLGALAPLPVVIAITLLMSHRGGLAKSVGFAVGLTGTFAIIGVVVLLSAGVDAGSSTKGSAVTGTIIAVLGAVLLVMALKQLLHAPDPDAGPPKLMTKLDSMAPAGALVLGLVIALINIKQLGIYVAGVSQIVAADVTSTQSWVALFLLLLILQAGVLTPLAVFLVAPRSATSVLNRFRVWLVSHNREIAIVLGLVVGVGFLIKGIAQISS